MTKNHFLVFYPIKVEFLDRIFLQLGVFDHRESESLIKNISYQLEMVAKSVFLGKMTKFFEF